MLKDCGTYWLDYSVQGSPGWFTAREKKVTASTFGSLLDGVDKYTSYDDLLDIKLGLKKKTFTEYSKMAMAQGVKLEPEARQWYIDNFTTDTMIVDVEEVGLAIPKFNDRIGGSPDGIVRIYDNSKKLLDTGLIEIKCPQRMYYGCKNYQGDQSIYGSHYAQMQGCMAIMDKSWCDYVVYVPDDDEVFSCRVLRNEDYWNYQLYPKICQFLKDWANGRQ